MKDIEPPLLMFGSVLYDAEEDEEYERRRIDRIERAYEYADMRRKELREEELLRKWSEE